VDAKILATDIDANVIEVARAGRYKRDALGPLGSKLERDYFAIDPETDTLQIRDTIKKKVSFGELNLVSEIPVRGPFDAIFCRNVAIYFETETQQKLWNVFANLLSPDGLLFIGHSERVTGPALKKLKICGVTTYRRSDS
jgi:chemotaxis protein methyltransferase CheR